MPREPILQPGAIPTTKIAIFAAADARHGRPAGGLRAAGIAVDAAAKRGEPLGHILWTARRPGQDDLRHLHPP